jgi:hypothetical protein
MTNINPIHGKNLSEAWAHAFIRCMCDSGRTIAPGIVSFDVDEEKNSWQLETTEIRHALDNQLLVFNIASAYQSNIETVAGTIFPESIWKRCGGNSEEFFKRYNKMWPFIRKCRFNMRGTYFRRLTAFGEQGTNQLKTIIDTWRIGTHRHGALQAGIFNPAQDHTKARRLGFPCLQQVVFHPIGTNGIEGMSVVAFYANQYLLEKAYGNYLGLYRLGKFMAGEMGLNLRGVTCIATNLSLGNCGKQECRPLLDRLKKVLHDAN